MTIVFFMGADNDAMNFGCQWEIDRPWRTLQPPIEPAKPWRLPGP
jgi:hypothetical protein